MIAHGFVRARDDEPYHVNCQRCGQPRDHDDHQRSMPPVVEMRRLPRGASEREKFERFHGLNPALYALMVANATRKRDEGHRCYGVKALFEELRFVGIVVHGASRSSKGGFKLPNSFTAYYARLLNREPGCRGMFRMRKSRADD